MHCIPLLSFFSGGGFLDLGFEMAGFDIKWSNEFEEKYATIYQTGISSWHSGTKQDAKKLPLLNLDSIEKLSDSTILRESFGSIAPDFFGVIGGPPCQDFTSSGKNEGFDGERGRHTQNFIDIICRIKPSFFMMENVPGLYKKKHRFHFNRIVSQLENSGYLTSAKILSALELGIPQNRDRLFLIGFRNDLIGQELDFNSLIGSGKEWFNWPKPLFENAKTLNWPQTNPFGNENLKAPEGIPLQLMVNDLLSDDAEKLPNGTDVFTPFSKKFALIAEGDVSGKSFKRLHRYRYSPTAWYGNNEVHLHPWKKRRLSVREALRIQTVPDEYVMPSTSYLSDKFRVISNGVPTSMAKQIAEAIYCYIAKKDLYSAGK